MSYLLYNSDGTINNNTLVNLDQNTGYLYIISNSEFTLNLYIQVTSSYKTNYNSVNSNQF